MKRHLMLLKLQIKSAFLALPAMLAGTVVFGALMVFGALGAVEASKAKQESGELLKVQVVYPEPNGGIIDESAYIREAFRYLEKIDTVKNVCTFEEAESEADAVERLKKGQVAAVIVIPEKFIRGIINGDNIPVRIIFAENGITTSSSLFREMLRAAGSDLSTAQAGVYALSDVFERGEFTGSEELKANAYLNAKYMAYVIDRNAYYETVETGGRNSLNIVQFYSVTAVVLLILLGTIVCEALIKPEKRILQSNLRRVGISSAENYIYKIVGVSLLFWMIYGIIYFLCALAVIRYPAAGYVITFVPKSGWILNIAKGVLGILPLVVLAFSVAGLVYALAGKTVSGVIMMFLLSVVMVFASGRIMPESMLPEAVAAIGRYFPTAVMSELCGQILNGTVAAQTVGTAAVYSAGLLAVTGIVHRVRG